MSRSKSTAELARIRIYVTRPSHFITFLSLLNKYRGGGGEPGPSFYLRVPYPPTSEYRLDLTKILEMPFIHPNIYCMF